MPEPIQVQEPPAPAPAPSNPAPAAPQPGLEGTPGPGPAPGPPSPAPAPTPAPAPGGQFDSVRAHARSLGIQGVEQFPDDASFLQHLYLTRQQAGQSQQLAQYGQEYLQHRDQFNVWQQQQQAAEAQRAAAAQEKAKWWNPPPFDPSWRDHVEQDPATGQLRTRAGSDPAILPRYQAHQAYRQEFARKLLDNPEATLGPMVEERAKAIAAAEHPPCRRQAQGPALRRAPPSP